ncbi:hypothetical protein EAS68_08870 [Legionella jordanis]|uniref:flagellar protein FlaG n=1 Tax=Legionella jordanis TaxID=456 RepID=UPI000EFE8B8F|nr:flagellar protein FlaG [Legionella jordanis]RMX18212.1 hypothetical protein EAS68_08870 [Legionella jordanis]
MNIEIVNKPNSVSVEPKPSTSSIEFNQDNASTIASDTKYAIDEATGILQAIVTNKLSDEVIRKIPADEYLHLLSLVDEMISGSIDKQV